MRTINRAVWLLAGLVISIAALPVVRDTASHSRELMRRAHLVDGLLLERYGEVVFSHDQTGLLFGNGNHTNYWVVRLLKTTQPPDQVIFELTATAAHLGLEELRIQPAPEAMNGWGEERWHTLRIHETWYNAQDVIVIQHLGEDSAGCDPRSH